MCGFRAFALVLFSSELSLNRKYVPTTRSSADAGAAAQKIVDFVVASSFFLQMVEFEARAPELHA